MKARLRDVGVFALILGLGISLYGYMNQAVPVCAPCIEGRPCPPCPSPQLPDYTYFGIAIATLGMVLILSSLFRRAGANKIKAPSA